MKYLLIIFVLVGIGNGCKKAEERTCWKGNGTASKTTIPLQNSSFNSIELNNDVDYILVPDTLNYLIINSYKNQIKHYNYNIEDSLLVLKDLNKCRFLRDFDKKTTIEIHFKNLNYLHINGNGTISSSSPITNNILHIYSHSANSDIDLKVDANSLVIKCINGTLTGKVTGRASSANIFHFGYSNVNFEQLDVTYLNISNKSDSDVYVSCSSSLNAELFSLGDIYYKGYPTTTILINKTGSKLINNN